MSGEAATIADVLPRWLRPASYALVIAAHAGVLVFAHASIEAPPSLDSMEVSLMAEGNSVADQTPQEEVKPQQEAKADDPPPPPPPPPPAPELAAPPPQTLSPDAPPLPIARQKPAPRPRPVVEEEEDDEPSPAELREMQRRKRLAEQRRREAQEERREAAAERAREARQARKAQEARAAARRGVAGGARAASGMSRASFAGLVVAQLNRHKFFPAAARARGASGSVGVAFTIGSSGRVVSQSVTRSSGDGALDSAARAIMSAIHTPPPPGGNFSTSTTIRFSLN